MLDSPNHRVDTWRVAFKDPFLLMPLFDLLLALVVTSLIVLVFILFFWFTLVLGRFLSSSLLLPSCLGAYPPLDSLWPFWKLLMILRASLSTLSRRL